MKKVEYVYDEQEITAHQCMAINMHRQLHFHERHSIHYHLDGYCDDRFKFHLDIMTNKKKTAHVIINPN